MRFEATTQINYDTYRKYFLFSFLQGKRSPWQARLLIAFIPVMFAAFLVLYLQNLKDTVSMVGMLIMLSLGLILLYILFIMPRRYYRSVRNLIEIPNHYVFTDEHFEVSQNEHGGTDTCTSRYEMILKVYETKEFFYIYVGPNQAHIIGKHDFTQGSIDGLRQLLKTRISSRYVLIRAK